MYTRNSFYEDEGEVPSLLAEIDRLKRKALSRGVNLTSANERNPWSKAITLYRLLSFQSANSSSRRSVSGCIVYILWQFEIEPLPSPQLFLKIVSWLPVGQRDKVVQVPAKVDLAREHAS